MQTHYSPYPTPRILHWETWGRVGGHFSHRETFFFVKISNLMNTDENGVTIDRLTPATKIGLGN